MNNSCTPVSLSNKGWCLSASSCTTWDFFLCRPVVSRHSNEVFHKHLCDPGVQIRVQFYSQSWYLKICWDLQHRDASIDGWEQHPCAESLITLHHDVYWQKRSALTGRLQQTTLITRRQRSGIEHVETEKPVAVTGGLLLKTNLYFKWVMLFRFGEKAGTKSADCLHLISFERTLYDHALFLSCSFEDIKCLRKMLTSGVCGLAKMRRPTVEP